MQPDLATKKISKHTRRCRNFRPWVFLLTVFFATLTGKTSIAFSDKTGIDHEYQQARTLAEFEKIAEQIQKILEKETLQPEWEWRLARSHYSIAKKSASDNIKSHHYIQCVDRSSRALKMQQDSAISYFFRALCRGKQGEMKGIWASLEIIQPFEADMKKAMQLDPGIEHGGPPRALGNLYFELPFFLGGSLDRSITYFEEAVRLAPDFAENYLGLAKSYYARNNFDLAQKSLLTLMRLTDNIVDDDDLLNFRAQGQALAKKLTPALNTYD